MKTVEEISLLIFRIYIVMSVILTPATVKLKIFYIYKLNSPGVFCEKCLIFPASLPPPPSSPSMLLQAVFPTLLWYLPPKKLLGHLRLNKTH